MLTDARLHTLARGTLVHPSSHARAKGNGGYFDSNSGDVLQDSQVFPGLLLDPKGGELLSPAGLVCLSQWCMVSVEEP